MEELTEKVYTVDYILENKIDKKAYGFIYITTNLINGTKYIGQRKFNNGWKNYLGSGTILKKAIKKNGKENFHRDIVLISYNLEDSNKLEKNLIIKYNAINNSDFYNIADGGKQSNTIAGKTNDEIKEIRKKQSNSLKGKLSGIKNPMYGTKGYWYGKKLSDIHKHNAVENKKIKPIGKNNPRAKQIILLNTMEIFNTIREASIKYNINHGDISACCKGKFNFIGKLDNGTKLVWRYYDDYMKLTKNEIELLLNKSNYEYRAKRIICLNTNEIFNSIKEGSMFYNISRKSITNNIKLVSRYAGKHPVTGEKLVWMFYDDYIKEQNNKAS